METNLEKLLLDSERMLTNIEKMLKAFRQVSNNSEYINIDLLDADGNNIQHQIKNHLHIENELLRLKNIVNNFVNNTDTNYILNADGSYQTIMKTDFTNTGYVDAAVPAINCKFNYDSILNNLTYPNVTMPVKLADDLIETNIRCTIYNVSSGYTVIPDDVTLHDLEFLIQSKSVYAKKSIHKLTTEKQQITNSGKFNIETIDSIDANGNIFACNLNSITYKTINNNETLKVDDLLVDNANTYKIIAVDEINNAVNIQRINGVGIPSVGIDKLYFNSIVDSTNKVVNVPVLPDSELVIFLSTENHLSISFPSKSLKVNTANLTVTTTEDGEISLKQYFQKYVTNLSDYFDSLINESSIPFSLGIKPKTLKLDARNFNVVQINKHLTSDLTKSELEELNKNKVKVINDIEYANNQIEQLNNELLNNKLKTNDEIDYRNNKIKQYRNEIIILEQNKLVLTRKIDNNAVKYGLKDKKAKYKVVGFCEVLKPILSVQTLPQKIIKYEFWYRYLSKNNSEIKATTYKMYDDNDNVVDITVSPWNVAETKMLQKQKIDGKFDWVDPNPDSSEDININQCLIGINEGESIEIKVRAISEAGHPISQLKGEWSNILRVDFPTNLTENSVNLLINKNVDDLKISEFQNVIRQSGVYEHMSDRVTDGQKSYKHHSNSIASGFFTDERRIIPLFDLLNSMRNELIAIKNVNAAKKLTLQFVDYTGEAFNIENNSTLDIDGGAYGDEFNLLDSSAWGSIVTLKNYIKIVNSNDVPVEIKTLMPGVADLDAINSEKYFDVPILNTQNHKQSSKQILYFRNVDITNQQAVDFRLYSDPLGLTSVNIPTGNIDTLASEEQKNIVFIDTNDELETCKLLSTDNLDFVAYTKEHSLFVDGKLPELKLEFNNHLKKFNANLKVDKSEKLNDNLLMGFTKNDKFAVGKNSTGAMVYPIFNNIAKFSVVGNNTTSTLIIPKNSEILLPIIFEYRMMDRLGIINGDSNLTVTDNIVYRKKLGVDLLLNNELISFDLQFKANLKSEITPIAKLNVSGITGNLNTQD